MIEIRHRIIRQGQSTQAAYDHLYQEREILMREERAVNARLTLIEQQATYARARVVFESAQGTLLQRWSR